MDLLIGEAKIWNLADNDNNFFEMCISLLYYTRNTWAAMVWNISYSSFTKWKSGILFDIDWNNAEE